MNTVRDNTSKVGIGIGRMSKGDLKAFHAAFKAADADLDKKVCKNGSGTGDDEKKKCKAGTDGGGLEEVYKEDKIDVEAGPNIAKSIIQLSKEEKATLAAAFAKAVEGDAVWEERGLRWK